MTTDTMKLSAIEAAVKFPKAGANLLELIRLWRSRSRQRRDLAELTLQQLQDAGISVEAARAETAKRFWQA